MSMLFAAGCTTTRGPFNFETAPEGAFISAVLKLPKLWH